MVTDLICSLKQTNKELNRASPMLKSKNNDICCSQAIANLVERNFTIYDRNSSFTFQKKLIYTIITATSSSTDYWIPYLH